MYVECPLRSTDVDVGSWVLYVGIVGDVNIAQQMFSVAFNHELFLKRDDGVRPFLFNQLNSRSCYLVARARAIEQWLERAAECGAGMVLATQSWVSDGCPRTTYLRYQMKPNPEVRPSTRLSSTAPIL